MSNLLFRDTVTLYTPLPDGSYARRTVRTVKVIHRVSALPSLTLYLPLYGRRGLRYLPPHRWEPTRTQSFTVTVGQLLVPYACREATPPLDALTVKEIVGRHAGSRRLHHLHITAAFLPAEEETVEGTDRSAEDTAESTADTAAAQTTEESNDEQEETT